MPAMPRANMKATKIVYKILGVPANMKKKKLTPEQILIRKRLLFEETSRVR